MQYLKREQGEGKDIKSTPTVHSYLDTVSMIACIYRTAFPSAGRPPCHPHCPQTQSIALCGKMVPVESIPGQC